MKIHGAPSPLSSSIEFREGKGMLIPYLKMPLVAASEPVLISELIISPSPNPELARIAGQFLLDKHQVFDVSQDNSGVSKNSLIPFRNW